MVVNQLVMIVGILLFFGIIGAIIWYLTKDKHTPIPPNAPFVTMFNPSENGFSHFILLEIKSDTFGNYFRLKLKPLDLQYLGSEPQIVDSVIVTTRKELLIQNEIGSVSLFRPSYYLLPSTSLDLNEKFRNTPFGKLISRLIQDVNGKDETIEMMKENMFERRREITQLSETESMLREKRDEFIGDMMTKNKEMNGNIQQNNDGKGGFK